MKAIARIALTVLVSVLSSTLSAQTTIWNEFVNGDLPPSLSPVGLGDNRIIGAVGTGSNANNPGYADSDTVDFRVPTGSLLNQVLVRADSGDSYLNFALYGEAIGQGNIAFLLLNPGTTTVDLLSAPGPRPAGVYSFSVGPGGTVGFKSYTLDIVTIQVPETSTVALLCAGFVVLTFAVRRFR